MGVFLVMVLRDCRAKFHDAQLLFLNVDHWLQKSVGFVLYPGGSHRRVCGSDIRTAGWGSLRRACYPLGSSGPRYLPDSSCHRWSFACDASLWKGLLCIWVWRNIYIHIIYINIYIYIQWKNIYIYIYNTSISYSTIVVDFHGLQALFFMLYPVLKGRFLKTSTGPRTAWCCSVARLRCSLCTRFWGGPRLGVGEKLKWDFFHGWIVVYNHQRIQVYT